MIMGKKISDLESKRKKSKDKKYKTQQQFGKFSNKSTRIKLTILEKIALAEKAKKTPDKKKK